MTALASFSTACGQHQPLRLAVEHADGGRVADGVLDQPFALIGSADGCDVTLTHPDVPERVACLQVLDGTAFVVTLAGFAVHHLTPESPFAIGPFVLRLFESPTAAPPMPVGDPLRDPLSGRPLPAVQLLYRGATPARELDHRWTFLGFPRGAGSVEVQNPQAYVVLTPDGPFVVDLLTATARVNGDAVRVARLTDGDELTVGHDRYTVAVGRSDPAGRETPALGSVVGALLGGPPFEAAAADEELVPLVPFTPDPALAAVLQKLDGVQSLLLDHFRQKLDDLLADFGNLRREQLVALRNELARLTDGSANGVTTLPPQPVGRPVLLPPRPADELPVSDETAAVHQAVYDRLVSLEHERQGLWARLRGILGG